MNDSTAAEIERASAPVPTGISDAAVTCPVTEIFAGQDQWSSGVFHTLEDAGCPLATETQKHVRFETLLTELSSRFVSVLDGDIDSQIESGLKLIVELLGIDRSGFAQLVPDENLIQITHSFQVPGVPPTPKVILESQFPTYARKIREGEAFRLPDDLLPDATTVELEYLAHSGLKSQLTIPLKARGAVVGAIGFASFRSRMEWPVELIRRLRLVGDIFTNALTRKQADEVNRRGKEQARALRNELAHATRLELVGHLTTSIAHEVNQPLCAIASNAQTAIDLLEMGDIEEATKALKDIWEDAKRASDVIGNIRGMVRKEESFRSPTVLADVIERLLPILRREANGSNVGLRTDLSIGDLVVVCDPVQVQQVLLNLHLNAVEAVRTAGIDPLEIVIRAWQEDGQWGRISIEDTAIGLSAADCERVFAPFFSTKPKGLGMGLSISRSIIEDHGGKLWATPGTGQGTVFHIRLPVASGGQQ